ncbi:MAG: exodeoxyribonuclease V subunit gamma [Desulfobulbaceae bacterium]|nr:exodeoxyribonuclease V subunit gamma [Desulfobulbaceae bacterium]HIJ77835.1 exodeoxyribonuclease V subunit gamma [Deltaproteobacteria bacterium]
MNNCIKIYRSNKVELLLAALSDILSSPLASPFAPECIMVQSKGMATWLNMQLSAQFGVWANPDYPHPRQFVQRLLRSTLGREGDLVERYSRERLTFAIIEILPACLAEPEFASLAHYVGAGDGVKVLQLASHIADTFDQYVVFRPELILAWEDGDNSVLGQPLNNDSWQPALWRRLVNHLGCCSPARLMVMARDRLLAQTVLHREMLPDRIAIFGIAGLPPLYLSLFDAVAKILPVHLFLLSPSVKYWGDIMAVKEMHRRSTVLHPEFCEDLHLEVGNPMLASFGFVGRDLQRLIEAGITYELEQELYVDQENPQTMLEVIQHDILNLQHRRPGGEDVEPLPMAPDDGTIVIHSCYSRLRELEVLQDQLLELLHNDRELMPRDVLILLPDVATYAPLVDAVFDRPASDSRYIPYRVGDRSLLGGAQLIDVFFRILQLAPGRMASSELLAILACEAVREHFSIGEDDLDQIRSWVADAGICWGIDEGHRKAHQQPADRQNTWRFGFDRLLLGYATGNSSRIFNRILPYDEIEGQGADLLGRFIYFCENFFDWTKTVAGPCSIGNWQQRIFDLLDSMFNPDSPQAWQLQKIRDAMGALVTESAEVGLSKDFELGQLQLVLQDKLLQADSGQGFLEGGLSFCGMLPMRSIPFKVVCLLGMNDHEFPRLDHPQSFDLLARYPRSGDRSKRNDDRYIFLEALLAARSKFMIFYQGNSARDGSHLPPSIVVEELLDVISQSFVPAGDRQDAPTHHELIVERLTVRHPLQPYSSRYFTGNDSRLFSYGDDFLQAARQRAAATCRPQSFLAGPLPETAEAPAHLSLLMLHRFFQHPVRWFLKNRLLLNLDDYAIELNDREPVMPDNLEKYHLGAELLRWRMANSGPPEEVLATWQGRGIVPLGEAAHAIWEEVNESVRPLLQGLQPFIGQPMLMPLTKELRLTGGLTLVGELHNRFAECLLCYTNKRLQGGLLLSAWLDHLFLSAAAPADQQPITTLICKGESAPIQIVRFSKVIRAGEILGELASLFVKGDQEPLLFFPKSSYHFARIISAGDGEDPQVLAKARDKAAEIFSREAFGRKPENDDLYYLQLFQGADPLPPGYRFFADRPPAYTFEELALIIFSPLLAHLEVVA